MFPCIPGSVLRATYLPFSSAALLCKAKRLVSGAVKILGSNWLIDVIAMKYRCRPQNQHNKITAAYNTYCEPNTFKLKHPNFKWASYFVASRSNSSHADVAIIVIDPSLLVLSPDNSFEFKFLYKTIQCWRKSRVKFAIVNTGNCMILVTVRYCEI